MPNTRENLIIEKAEYFASLWEEKLRDVQDKSVVRFIDNGVTLANQVASSSKQVASSEWIPVTERLPELYCGVSVYTPEGKNIYEVYLNARGEWHFFDESVAGRILQAEATHWMPLPMPPEGE